MGIWYDGYSDIVEFAHYLVEEQQYKAGELLGYLDKPWNWQNEYDEWQEGKKSEKVVK